jgi:monovalent cation/proton antiporter MnhG/PhaG subunit
MSLATEILASALILLGSAVVALAALGVARLPDPFTRMHAATKAGVVGSGLLLLGAAAALGTPGAWLTAFAGIAFLLATAPIAGHVLGRAAYVAGAPIAPATVIDALSGVLDRRVFDIDPARRPRVPRPAPQEGAMNPVPLRDAPASPGASPGASPARRVVCWLGGGGRQRAAIEVAADLAAASRARLLALSAIDPAAGPPAEPVPAGGGAWARWLADRRRARMREAAASALRDFDDLTRGRPVETASRHDETGIPGLAAAMAGCDLLVAPAGTGFHGADAPPAEEFAATLARRSAVPVLRVRGRPAAVRSVLLVVSGTSGCPELARRYLRSGLWPDAALGLLPVADHRPGVRAAIEGQAELLRAHGRRVAVLEPLDLDFEAEALAREARRFDAAAMSCLSDRGGWFGAVRNCPFEVVSAEVPVTLLP